MGLVDFAIRWSHLDCKSPFIISSEPCSSRTEYFSLWSALLRISKERTCPKVIEAIVGCVPSAFSLSLCQATTDACVRKNLELATAAFDQSCKYVCERAAVGCQREQRGEISIMWSLEDVKMQAKNNGYILNDGEAQKVLDTLKDKQDCTIGITWDVIDDYLSYIVPDSLEDEELLAVNQFVEYLRFLSLFWSRQ